jgi:DHA3 family tetracycline resistance protein-like MFS transporter
VSARRGRIALLRPLRARDFRTLWIGSAISLLGDGVFPVALAWQVLRLSNAPTALALVSLTWTLPQVPLMLLSGVASDRFDRRRVLALAVTVQGLAVGAMGVLAVGGSLRLSHVVALAIVYGSGEAFFGPASTAIVPDLVEGELLVEANALQQFVRPMAMNFVGPALGGVIVGAAGAGWAFLIDAASFGVAASFALAVRHRRDRLAEASRTTIWHQVAEGLRFVRARAWLWGAMVTATVALLAFVGPVDVLVPFIVKNELNGDASQLGLVFAAGGVGAIAASAILGQRGLPKRPITFMYLTWAVSTFSLTGFAVAHAIWQAMLVSALMHACFAGVMVAWYTLMQTLVPGEILGRVSSLDWMISAALVPVSFAATGPIASAVGARPTMAVAGLVGGTIVLLFFGLVRGIRQPEVDGSLGRPSSTVS